MSTATRPATQEDIPYPRVHQQETQIQELERKLKFIIQKGESLIIQKEALLRLPDTPSTQRQWEEFRVQVVANKSERDLTTDKLTLFKKDLPQLLDEAEKAEVSLTGKKEEIKGIKTQIKKIDKEITKALQKPIVLIKSRQEAVLQLGKTANEIQKLTSTLRWHPVAQEIPPVEPAAVRDFQELFPPRVVRWRGR